MMVTNETRQTQDQQRAARAYGDVKSIVNLGTSKKALQLKRKYLTYAKDLPVMVLQCGIGQTLAYLDSKRKGKESGAEARLLGHLSAWVSASRGVGLDQPPEAPVNWFIGQLLAADARVWRAATDEAVAFATWVKRFSEALIVDVEAGDADDIGDEADDDNGEK